MRVIEEGELTAYVSDVPLTEFGEEPLRRSMEDLAWLEETARAHHRIVEAVARSAPTAPVRLVTVYHDDAQVRELLRERHSDFLTVLARVADRREWGVKAYAVQVPAQPAAPEPETGPGTSPGRAYLQRRRTALRGREEMWRTAAAQAEKLHDALTGIAAASTRHRVQDPKLSGREEPMVLNGAYLVDSAREREFAALARDMTDLEVEITGPWAPYSFTALPGEAAHDDSVAR
ncbi:GvpL/GvpF family gas vesicle protein [Thermocatellispora tengchongensis]|uniref:GvpL/GvpF family gas vesicle protein n=1 Tax=Thermocatellispora tengchongensis TaxID=1073253 RepID=UPI003637FE87